MFDLKVVAVTIMLFISIAQVETSTKKSDLEI